MPGTTVGPITTTQSYNPFGELATATATVNNMPQYAVTYTRDKLGRITEQVETLAGVTTTFEYTYDPAGRLTAVTKNGLTVSTYTYDANGNRLRHSGTTGTYDGQDRLLQYGMTTYTYTANGELHTTTDTATGQTTTYDYDVLGNLRSVTLPDGTAITYLIDGQNRRIGKQINIPVKSYEQKVFYLDDGAKRRRLSSSPQVCGRRMRGRSPRCAPYAAPQCDRRKRACTASDVSERKNRIFRVAWDNIT